MSLYESSLKPRGQFHVGQMVEAKARRTADWRQGEIVHFIVKRNQQGEARDIQMRVRFADGWETFVPKRSSRIRPLQHLLDGNPKALSDAVGDSGDPE